MKEKNIKEKTQQKKKMGLTTKIFVALIEVQYWESFSVTWFLTAASRKM